MNTFKGIVNGCYSGRVILRLDCIAMSFQQKETVKVNGSVALGMKYECCKRGSVLISWKAWIYSSHVVLF